MIIFSPHTKFTMQRISDHVANGAYLYAKIDWKEYNENPNNYKFKREDKYENKTLENEIKYIILML